MGGDNVLLFAAPQFAGLISLRKNTPVSSTPHNTPAYRSTTKRTRRAVVCSSPSNTDAAQKTIFDYGVFPSHDSSSELLMHPIQLMACDMDGTMLNHAVQISPQNIAAVKRLLSETDIHFVPATGKSRSGALRSMGTLGEHLKDLHPNGCPGVYLQGLIVFGLDGKVVHEDKCDTSLSGSVIQLSKELDLDLIAYSRDDILCERTSEFTDLLPVYHEPAPEALGSWEHAIGSRPLNKFIFVAEPEEIDRIRPFVANRVGSAGVLTQAQGNMLEVLPPDSSKGNGVKLLLDSIGIEAGNVLAIGDAENDLEMLSMVRYSCAVDNALPSVKTVARYTDIKSNNDSGVAHAIERFILSRLDLKA